MTTCGNNGAVDNTTATPISADQARSFHGRAGVEFVDPRPAPEIAATTGRIPSARLISLADLESGNLPAAFADRSLHVVTTCHAGPMGAHAAAALARLGFARVNWVEGGTQAWIDAGHATV